jgi:LPXTG-site transpeptidase (sortase) family protein
MSVDERIADSDSHTTVRSSQSPSRPWRWLSTVMILVGVLLLGGGGLMAYLNSGAVAEPPAAVGLVEPLPAPSSLEENPLPVLSDSEPAVSEIGPESPPGLDQNPLPVFAEGKSPEAEVDYAPSVSTTLPVIAASSAGPESEASVALQGAADEAIREAERDVPGGPPPTPAPDSIPAAADPPTRIVIPAIDLDSEIVPVGWKQILQGGRLASVWEVAEYAAGWHQNSALPGAGGNVVLSGHHNTKGEVFRYIVGLEPGDAITIYADERPYVYVVESRFVVRDKGETEEKRRENARWIGPFTDERLTLVTCWPYTNNTHRVIVVAKPIQ